MFNNPEGIDVDEIKEAAIIYRKETSRPLSNYQKRMNEASQKLCMANPSYLTKRKDAARTKILNDGFQFVKGKSRSKKQSGKSDDGGECAPKRRKYISQEVREERLKNIKDDVKDLNEQIYFKEKRISAYENIQDYKKCDDVKEEITGLKHKRRLLELEKRKLV